MHDEKLKRQLQSLKKVKASQDLRKRIQLHIDTLPQESGGLFFPQLAVRSLIALAVLLLAGGGGVVATTRSQPGDFLYPIKTAVFKAPVQEKQEVEVVEATPEAASPSASLEPEEKPQDKEEKEEEKEERKEKEEKEMPEVLGEKDEVKNNQEEGKSKGNNDRNWRRFLPPGLVERLKPLDVDSVKKKNLEKMEEALDKLDEKEAEEIINQQLERKDD